MTIAYLNGEFIALDKARISPMDRGFLFGDGVYEIIPVYNGKIFRLTEHLQRLKNSLHSIKLNYSIDEGLCQEIFTTLVHQNDGANQSIYLQITRGTALAREHAFPNNIYPTVFAYSIPLVTPSKADLAKGISAITVTDIRWQRCDIKSLNLLANILLRQQALESGAQEAILINNDHAIEATASNLFIVFNNTIITPPLSRQLLGGITRDVVIELALQHQLPLKEANIPIDNLLAAEEVWLTSSTREITPVIKINHKIVGNGKAGPLWHKMIAYYQDYKQSLL